MPLQLNETLAHIAALVREDPSITVREIAKEMSFADNKSVYYWLGKAKFRGIGEFKKTVLGADSDSIEGLSVSMEQKDYFLLKVPLRDWDNIKKEDGVRWFYFLHKNPNPRGIFAIKVHSNNFSPWFLENDIIVVNTLEHILPGAWALVKQGRDYLIGRVGHNNQVLDPNTFIPFTKSHIRIVGIIITQQRNLI